MQHFNHALALLMEGAWAAGWAAYEVRRKAGVLAPHERTFTMPEWRGEPPSCNRGGQSALCQGAVLSPFDVHLPLMSLPHVLGTQVDSIPAAVPYLAANPAMVAGWESRFGHTRDPNIRIVWAGALGRPVWVMLPYALDWRWLRDREDSPWYPTMRLFRQSVPKVWTDVLARLRPELSERARQKHNGAFF